MVQMGRFVLMAGCGQGSGLLCAAETHLLSLLPRPPRLPPLPLASVPLNQSLAGPQLATSRHCRLMAVRWHVPKFDQPRGSPPIAGQLQLPPLMHGVCPAAVNGGLMRLSRGACPTAGTGWAPPPRSA